MAEFIPYFKKLQDPRWQRKRAEVLQSANYKCQDCGDVESTLHVHHNFYLKGKEPWDTEPNQLIVLCNSCHLQAEQVRCNLLRLFAKMPPRYMEEFACNLHWAMEKYLHEELMAALDQFLDDESAIKRMFKKYTVRIKKRNQKKP